MPQSADQKNDKQIQTLPCLPPAVSSQRDIDIIRKETGKRHMPSAPEVFDRNRLKRRIKILRQPEAKKLSDTARHITIAAKVKVQLHHIETDHNPR